MCFRESASGISEYSVVFHSSLGTDVSTDIDKEYVVLSEFMNAWQSMQAIKTANDEVHFLPMLH